MKKAGASNHDKVRVRRLYRAGRSAEQISALTSVRIEHVIAITKQVEAGTLKIGGAAGRDYEHGGVDRQEENIEQRAAQANVDEHHAQELSSLQRMLRESNERADKAEEAETAKAAELAEVPDIPDESEEMEKLKAELEETKERMETAEGKLSRKKKAA